MYRICFVILHYLSFETTKECIDSICNTFFVNTDYYCHIVVVDNASPNDSFYQLKKEYQANAQITLLQAPENLGFAKGNNIGYLYALEQVHADFVIVANNDTEFHQTEFLNLMIQTFETEQCALLGPDIDNIAGYHQNPYRSHPITQSELFRWMRNRRLWLLFLYADRYLHLTKHIAFFRNYYEKRSAAGRPQPQSWQTCQHHVVLHGACLIFTPLFLKEFPTYAFYPDTYMYCEEDILALLCNQKGMDTLYAPMLQVLHKESVSTGLSQQSIRDKDMFFTKNMLCSLKVLKKLLLS